MSETDAVNLVRDALAALPAIELAADVIDVWEAGDQESVRLVHPELAAALDKLMRADGR